MSNGFIAFDEEEYERAPTRYISPTPRGIPYGEAPNPIIAAVWTDLDIDADAKIITGVYQQPMPGGYTYFVVMWKNALHKKSGERLTFQIIMGNAWDYNRLVQSAIYVSYVDVKAIDTQFTWRIEDQQGLKGLGKLSDGADLQDFNGKTVTFSQNSRSFYLTRLTLTLEDTSTHTMFNILERKDFKWSHLRGYNIMPYGDLEPDSTLSFLTALAGTAALLIGGEAGFILGVVLVAVDWIDVISDLAYSQYGNRLVDVFDYSDEETNWAEAYASTWLCVDATLSIFVDWILLDANDQQHSLTITAKAEYSDFTDPDYPIDMPPITTTVNLEIKPDDNDDWNSADPVEKGTYPWLYLDFDYDPVDYYTIYVPQGLAINVKMTLPSYLNFNLFLYNSTRNLIDSSELGTGQSERVSGAGEGDWYVLVSPVSAYGFYSLEVNLPKAWDINGDGKTDIQDIAWVARRFGLSAGDPLWDQRADITGPEYLVPDGKIDLRDISLVASHFGETYPYDPPDPAAEGTASLSTDPDEVTVSRHEAFSIAVVVGNVTDLYAYQFELYYDAAVLNSSGVNMPPGHFLEPIDPSYIHVVKLEYDNAYNITHGRVWVAVTLMGDEPGKDGGGTLATINFTATAPGISTLNLQNVKLTNSSVELIPTTLGNGSVTVLPSLTILAEDQEGTSLTAGDVYIDGELVGYTGSTFNVSAGTHEVFVNDFWESGNTGYRYGFSHWEDNSTTNPRNITVAVDTTITAYFNRKWGPGDVNGDGKVDIRDKAFVSRRFGAIRGDLEWDSRADLNRDNKINGIDLAIVSSNYGNDYT